MDASASVPPTANPFLASPRSAYVHIPFCAHKCGYCDFASVAGQDEFADRYLEALEREIASVLPCPASVETIFIGGGTPTYVTPAQLDRMLDIVCRWLPTSKSAEFTVESNPNTLTADKVAILADHGVNRVSLGAQSFHQHLLTRLERNHEPESVARAVEMLRKRIANVSLDLIFGISGQTMDEWQLDLDAAIAIQPNHLSAYALTYEKGTPLWKQRQLGIVEPLEDDLEADMYEHLLDRMEQAGFDQYEISNFALRGNEDLRCRHNGTYWANEPYFGFGTGAAAFVNGARTLNLRPLITYMERVEQGESPICQSETLEPESRARETAVLQLRRNEGIDREDFEQRTGYTVDELLGKALVDFVEMELLTDDGRCVQLTRQGRLLADGVLSRIV